MADAVAEAEAIDKKLDKLCHLLKGEIIEEDIAPKNIIREKLMQHRGHNIACVSCGDCDNPADVYIKCEDCCEVLISAKDFDIPNPNDNFAFKLP